LVPAYSRAERVADAVVHVVGVFFGLIGAAALLLSAAGRLPFRDIAGLGIYSMGLIGMFSASASYNLVRRPNLKEWYRRDDHADIYVMNAGS
jgi:hemolysin III